MDTEFNPRTRARSTDPDTSLEAAKKVVSKINKLQGYVLAYFTDIYPKAATDLDMQESFGSHLSTYRTRRAELTARGFIADSGQRKFQKGRKRVLWVWTGKGRGDKLGK